MLFQNKAEVWEKIEAKIDAENDTPALKTSNKVCNSKLCVSKCVYLVDVCVMFAQCNNRPCISGDNIDSERIEKSSEATRRWVLWIQ